jgi:hypothetical protein
MLQLNRTQSARAGKMGGMSKYTKGQYHLLVKYTKRAGRNFTASNSADAVSSAPGRFARDGSTGRYPDQETAMGCATLFRTHVENVLFAEDELRVSPKAHPEVAGAGIEFDWGISKKWFRRHNTYKPKETEGLVRASLAVVTMLMAKKTARRARSYLRAYRNPDAVSYSLIEKFVKLHKTHRNILDQETAYLEKMVKLCSEIKKEAGFFKEAAERDERERDAEARDEARLLEALCAELHM